MTNANIVRFADEVRARFGFGFVGVSVIPEQGAEVLEWNYGSGGLNSNFELIRLPAEVGALGKVYSLGRGIVVEDVVADIPENERFQYPIVVTEALQSFLAFPLLSRQSSEREPLISVVLICGWRFLRSMDEGFCAEVQHFCANLFSLLTCGKSPIYIKGRQEGFAYSELPQKVMRAQEEERSRIARELHDGVAQEVLVAQMGLRALSYLPHEQWGEQVELVSRQLKDVMSHMSAMAKALRPPSLDELGLSAALRELAATTAKAFGLDVADDIQEVSGLGSTTELGMYRIAQEALSNAGKYAHASVVKLSLRQEGDEVAMSIVDDGCGFDTDQVNVQGSGLGLEGMRERAALAGGRLTVESAAGEGTRVAFTLTRGGLA